MRKIKGECETGKRCGSEIESPRPAVGSSSGSFSMTSEHWAADIRSGGSLTVSLAVTPTGWTRSLYVACLANTILASRISVSAASEPMRAIF